MQNTIKNNLLIQNASPEDLFLIVGYGLTGQATAAFLSSQGLSCLLFDDKPISPASSVPTARVISLSEALCFLTQKQVRAVFPSPGVPWTHPILAHAREQVVPMIGELELASFYLKGDFIAVTGTNGKSTTVKLINALLKDAGIPNGLKGNIGSPLIAAVNEPPKPFYVIEESSYQLELAGSLRHHIAICLNITEDHFDRYPGIQEYTEAKSLIIKNSQPDDWFIYNHDDRFCHRIAATATCKKMPFSLVQHLNPGAFLDGPSLVVRTNGHEERFDLKECSLKGLHNCENMLAALATVLIVNNSKAACASYRKTLNQFEGLPHRVQKVHAEQGIVYYDDSKGTNVGAVVMALAGFDGNVILLAGGLDKQCDFAPLRGIVSAKVKKLILFGQARERMHQALHDVVDTSMVEDMAAAMAVAKACATSGDTVLLSPACSSFDQYRNYRERGEHFVKLAKGG